MPKSSPCHSSRGSIFVGSGVPSTKLGQLQKSQSEQLGRHFWISPDGDFCSCPSFVDGTPDPTNIDPLEEWQGDDLGILEFNEIIKIYQRLMYRKEAGVGGWGLPDYVTV
jgi:hypothetical protein